MGKRDPLKCALLSKCGFVAQMIVMHDYNWKARVRIPSKPDNYLGFFSCISGAK